MSGWLSSASSRRSCGKVGILRSLRDFQARWNGLLLEFSTERLFHSFWRRNDLLHVLALGGVAPQSLRPVGEAESAVQMLMNRDRAAGQRGA